MGVEIVLKSDNIDKTLAEFEIAARKAMAEIGIKAEENVKREATTLIYDAPPAKSGYRRTGTLRNSITHDSTDDTAFVGCNVEYAPYVEYGTSKMPARPFIKNGVNNYQDQYAQILKKNMEKP